MGASFGTMAGIAGLAALGIATGGFGLAGEAAAVAGGATAGTAGAAGAGAAGAASSAFSIGNALTLAGTGIGALGAIQQGQASSEAAKYNASIAAANAQIASQNATFAGEAGTAQVEQASLQNRSRVGAIEANQAASGLDVNKGSAVDVRSSAQQLGELNAITVRSNAARQAYGYQTQATNYTAQSQLDKTQAENDLTSSYINAGGTVLGGLGTAASRYAQFSLGSNGSNIGASS